MKTLKSLSIALAGLGFSVSAVAGSIPLKPGLWEISSKVKSGGEEMDPQAAMREAMAQMPPEQRKQMEAMMKKQSGGSVGFSPSGATRICYTKELLDNAKSLNQNPKDNCTSTIKSQSASKMEMEFKCKDGTQGNGVWNFKSPTVFDVKMNITHKGEATEMSQTGKFIGSDCGTVKPLPVMKD